MDNSYACRIESNVTFEHCLWEFKCYTNEYAGGGTQQEGDHGWSRKPGQLPTTGEVMDLEGGSATTTLLNELGP